MNKTNIIIAISLIVLLVIFIQTYRIFTLISPPQESPTAHQESTVPESATAALKPTTIAQQLAVKPDFKSLVPTLSCDGYEEELTRYNRHRLRFVIEVAELSYLNGVDKQTLYDTITSEFGVAEALQFRDKISKMSLYHQGIESYKETLKKQLEIGQSFLQSNRSNSDLRQWARYQNFDARVIDHANLTISRYPDIAAEVWSLAADISSLTNFDTFAFSLTQLSKIDYHPIEGMAITQRVAANILQSSFNRQQKQQSINILATMNREQMFRASLKQLKNAKIHVDFIARLERLKFDTTALTYADINTVSFISDEKSLLNFKQYLEKFDKKTPLPTPEQWCKSDQKNKTVYTLQKVSLSQMASRQDYRLFSEILEECIVVNNMIDVSDFLTNKKWSSHEQFTIKALKSDSFKPIAETLKTQLADSLSIIFNYESGHSINDKTRRPEQLSLLIDHGIYPKDANIIRGMSRMSVDESLALLEKAAPIKPTNNYNATMVYNAVLTGNESLALTLINKGYPLTMHENAPDPLQAYLYRLSKMYQEKVHFPLLTALMANTPDITPWHINSMHRMKMIGNKNFEPLFSAFPELYPNVPATLMAIDCDGTYLEFE